jgi:hypothetical protein
MTQGVGASAVAASGAGAVATGARWRDGDESTGGPKIGPVSIVHRAIAATQRNCMTSLRLGRPRCRLWKGKSHAATVGEHESCCNAGPERGKSNPPREGGGKPVNPVNQGLHR